MEKTSGNGPAGGLAAFRLKDIGVKLKDPAASDED